MIHGNPLHKRRESHDGGSVRQTMIYLIGTVGVASILAFAIFVADRAGWLDDIQVALHHVKLPGLPSAPDGGLSEALPAFADNLRNTKQSSTTLWQRGSEHTELVQQPNR